MNDEIIQLIHPHTGDVHHIKPVTEGYGAATTAVVAGEAGEFFVKATPNVAGGNLDAARREAAINPFVLGISPEILWQTENDKWFVLAFEVVNARASDFLPGSPDLPTVVDVLDRVFAVPLPSVAADWQDTRWDRFATETEKALLRGQTLTHADIHGRNLLIGADHSWLVDWEWPTIGAAAIMPSCLAVQLVSSGHSPADAQALVSDCQAWKSASPGSLDAFAQANARMHHWFVKLRPEEEWLKAMATAAQAWADHCGDGSDRASLE
ncbi:protein kinase [Nocardiopsis dassonvillei]|uniref:protein kinase n=1 Tax=Nocardiopsis dassonvillei TaxID=2014 RepID=UPI00362853C0